MVRLSLETCLGALTNARSHDVAHILREERNVVADTDQEAGRSQMVSQLHQLLRKLVRVQEHEFVEELKWNSVVRLSDVLECVKKDFVGVLVVADFLLLLGDVDSDLDGLPCVS